MHTWLLIIAFCSVAEHKQQPGGSVMATIVIKNQVYKKKKSKSTRLRTSRVIYSLVLK